MFKMKQYRDKNNLSQRELGLILGVSARAISNYESGDREPNIEMLVKIASLMEITVDELIDFKSIKEKLNRDLANKIDK